jgi:transposase
MVREGVREKPLVTLQPLSDLIEQKFDVEASISHIYRIL